MKISKSLIQAILVGATLGTTASSCSMLDTITGGEEDVICKTDCKQHEHKRGDGPDSCWDCPTCGMG